MASDHAGRACYLFSLLDKVAIGTYLPSMENVMNHEPIGISRMETASAVDSLQVAERSARILITAERKVMVSLILRITRARRF
jgi:hypothetical protein